MPSLPVMATNKHHSEKDAQVKSGAHEVVIVTTPPVSDTSDMRVPMPAEAVQAAATAAGININIGIGMGSVVTSARSNNNNNKKQKKSSRLLAKIQGLWVQRGAVTPNAKRSSSSGSGLPTRLAPTHHAVSSCDSSAEMSLNNSSQRHKNGRTKSCLKVRTQQESLSRTFKMSSSSRTPSNANNSSANTYCSQCPTCIEQSKAAASNNSNDKQPVKRVQFSNLNVNVYPIILGDNAAVQAGAPIQLGWDVAHTYQISIDEALRYKVHHYYRGNNSNSSNNNNKNTLLPLSPWEREKWLLEKGYTKREIRLASYQARVIRYSRQANAQQTMHPLVYRLVSTLFITTNHNNATTAKQQTSTTTSSSAATKNCRTNHSANTTKCSHCTVWPSTATTTGREQPQQHQQQRHCCPRC